MTTDLPKTLIEAVLYFADLSVCHEYMRRIKWPGGTITCPKCGNDSVGEISTRPGLLRCNRSACGNQFSIREGTIFFASRLPLGHWFTAIWAVANGISNSRVLADALEITQRSAWWMVHTIHTARHLAPEVVYAPVPDWPPYRVGTDGSVWTRHRKGQRHGADYGQRHGAEYGPWRQLRTPIGTHGYKHVHLCDGDRSRTVTVPQLVLLAFDGPPEGRQECRHLNGNRTDDRLLNLVWGSRMWAGQWRVPDDLTRKLAQVPKDELDAQIARGRKERKAKRRQRK